jgi:hypothetical protein
VKGARVLANKTVCRIRDEAGGCGTLARQMGDKAKTLY